jgi:lysophospholipase L1-like esterase
MLVATLGDSITEGMPGYDSSLGGNEESQWQHWAAQALEGVEFRNCGVNRQRTDEIAERLEECAAGADVLIVQGGINDIAQGRELETAAENLRTMVQRGKELVPRVLLVEVLPWNNGYPDGEPKILQLNTLIRVIGDEEHVPVVHFHDRLQDPERAGRMREEWTSDGNHPSVEGYRLLGELVADALEPYTSR